MRGVARSRCAPWHDWRKVMLRKLLLGAGTPVQFVAHVSTPVRPPWPPCMQKTSATQSSPTQCPYEPARYGNSSKRALPHQRSTQCLVLGTQRPGEASPSILEKVGFGKKKYDRMNPDGVPHLPTYFRDLHSARKHEKIRFFQTKSHLFKDIPSKNQQHQ